jgi:MFS family permease
MVDYNLAERVYGLMSAPRRTRETNGAGYNLAERVYGPTSTPPRSRETNAAGYNLAERVHGDAVHSSATGIAAASLAAAPRRVDPPPAAAAVVAAGTVVADEPSRWLSLKAFKSLRIPAFRWYTVSALAMFAAMMTDGLVRGIVVFNITGSFSTLGTLALASAIPGLALSFYGGVIADRFPRKYVVQIGQMISAVASLIVGLLLLFDQLQVGHLMAASVVHGAMMATMMPARQAIIPEIVGQRYLMSSIALNSAGMNFMSLFAPTLGGFAVALYGGEWAYFGVSAAYFLAAVTMIPIPARPSVEAESTTERAGGGLSEIGRGLTYVWRTPAVFTVLIVSFLTSMLAMPYRMMLPGFVVEVFDAGAGAVGVLNGVAAAGSLVGALAIASMAESRRGQLLVASAALIGVGLVAFAYSGGLVLGGLFMLVIGLGTAGRQTLTSVLLQTHLDDVYRGRVMSIYMAQFQLMAFGTFFVGKISDTFGAEVAFAGLGVGLVLLSVILWASLPRIRRMD